MKKLIKIIALQDGFMENSEEQFCTENKEYEIIDQSKKEFCFLDDSNEVHWWDFDDCPGFKLIYEDEYKYETNNIKKKSIIYKHTKTGNLYSLLFEAKETDNATPVVVYQALYGGNQIWVRSAYEFYGFNENMEQRFENIEIERL